MDQIWIYGLYREKREKKYGFPNFHINPGPTYGSRGAKVRGTNVALSL
jgi:hypothetical protein